MADRRDLRAVAQAALILMTPSEASGRPCAPLLGGKSAAPAGDLLAAAPAAPAAPAPPAAAAHPGSLAAAAADVSATTALPLLPYKLPVPFESASCSRACSMPGRQKKAMSLGTQDLFLLPFEHAVPRNAQRQC